VHESAAAHEGARGTRLHLRLIQPIQYRLLAFENFALALLDLDACTFDAALRNAFKLSERWLAALPVEMRSLVWEIVEWITVAAIRIEIRLS
jgi:hypothetical protein